MLRLLSEDIRKEKYWQLVPCITASRFCDV